MRIEFGFDPKTEAEKLAGIPLTDRVDYLQQELTAAELHVFRDLPVSLPYFYQLKEGKVYSYPSKVPLIIDPQERDGYCQIGVNNTLKLALENPGRLIFLYSPPGPASFDENHLERYKKPYDIGQLYINWFDGKKIVNLAISINKRGERWLGEIYGLEFQRQISSITDERERIIAFITTPIFSSFGNIDAFLNHHWQDSQQKIFTSKNMGRPRNYNLSEILLEIKKSLTGQLKTEVDTQVLAEEAAKNGGYYISPKEVGHAWGRMALGLMARYQLTEIPLGGGCGGIVVRQGDLANIMPSLKLSSTASLSSEFRLIRQTSGFDNEEKDYHFDHEGICQNCHLGPKPLGPCNVCEECDNQMRKENRRYQ